MAFPLANGEQWFEHYDPKIHDAISGPVEEFLTNGAGLGYDEAKAGESFVRIGVGAVRKPDEPRYRRFSTYEIVDAGKWTVHHGADWIEFIHQLGDTGGYSYVYRKKLRLAKDKLIIEHHLKNTGRKTIAASVYDHNFWVHRENNEPAKRATDARFLRDCLSPALRALFPLTVFPGFRKMRSTLGHTLPPAPQAANIETPGFRRSRWQPMKNSS